jgi:putative acetyltransferase
MNLVIAVDDPRAQDVRKLLETHLAFAREVTPEGHVHALDVDALVDPTITLVGARGDGALLGIGAIKQISDTHGELKAMHTSAAARGRGVGGAILDQLLAVARERGYRRVSLETGTMDAFAPARSLYLTRHFVPCPPFGSYTDNPYSQCMTREIDRTP